MKIFDDGEYQTIKYKTHESNPCKVIISVKKSTNISLKSISSNHAKSINKSGA